MSFHPGPQHTLLMLRLIFGPSDPKLGELNLKSATPRRELERAGLISLEKRGRNTHVLVTDKGWQWTQAHLHVPFNPKSGDAGRILLALLPRLQRFMERRGCGLAELFEPLDDPPISLPELASRTYATLRTLGGGKTQQRLSLLQARAALPELTAATFDKVLLHLQAQGSVALYHEDDPNQRTAEVAAAAIRVGETRYHLVYLLGSHIAE